MANMGRLTICSFCQRRAGFVGLDQALCLFEGVSVSNRLYHNSIDQIKREVQRKEFGLHFSLRGRNYLSAIACLLVGCFTSQQQASVSQGRLCLDNVTCCHTEIEITDPTFYLTQSQYTDTGPTSPSADPIAPGAWQGSHWSANIWVTGMTRPCKNPGASGIRTRDLPLSRWTPYH